MLHDERDAHEPGSLCVVHTALNPKSPVMNYRRASYLAEFQPSVKVGCVGAQQAGKCLFAADRKSSDELTLFYNTSIHPLSLLFSEYREGHHMLFASCTLHSAAYHSMHISDSKSKTRNIRRMIWQPGLVSDWIASSKATASSTCSMLRGRRQLVCSW